MNDTMVTLVGNAATAVEHRQTTAGVNVARFRLAATSRRWDKAQERWTDGETSFYTVRSWRGLADNVAASVAVGEPLVVQGRLRLREGEQPAERGGQRWFSAEVDAVAIGHDLSRGTAAFRRVVRAARTGGDPPRTGADVKDAGGAADVKDAGGAADVKDVGGAAVGQARPRQQREEHPRPEPEKLAHRQPQLGQEPQLGADPQPGAEPQPRPVQHAQQQPLPETSEQPEPQPDPRHAQQLSSLTPLAIGAASAASAAGNSPEKVSVP
ncbi:single-stranded DNA-binding protein [Streptomyces sp. NPDC002446]